MSGCSLSIDRQGGRRRICFAEADTRKLRQQAAHALADDLMIVDDQDLHAAMFLWRGGMRQGGANQDAFGTAGLLDGKSSAQRFDPFAHIAQPMRSRSGRREVCHHHSRPPVPAVPASVRCNDRRTWLGLACFRALWIASRATAYSAADATASRQSPSSALFEPHGGVTLLFAGDELDQRLLEADIGGNVWSQPRQDGAHMLLDGNRARRDCLGALNDLLALDNCPCRQPCCGSRRHRHRSRTAMDRPRRAGCGQARHALLPAPSRSVRRARRYAARSLSSAWPWR